MMRIESSRPEQARIKRAADEAFSGLTGHETNHLPAIVEFPLPNADPRVGQLRGRFFAFAVAALAVAIFISLYLEIVKTVALKSELATARGDFETMVELASTEADKEDQLKKSAETATAELQQERQKTAALTSELAVAHGGFETKLASSSQADDKAIQPITAADIATAELQQERQ
ncbi:MAG: hypothetical protein JO141_25100, partial [Bradyrhizobium sp.]|nr:hypothetical protein [Bradyrhizobium sp.]